MDRKLAQLEAQGKKDTALYDKLVESEQQLATLETLKTSRVSVVRPRRRRSRSRRRRCGTRSSGLALGLVLGVGLAFAIDALDTRVRSADGDRRAAGAAAARAGAATTEAIREGRQPGDAGAAVGPGAEAFRMLRTNLDFARLERDDMKVILVVSAVEQEGKSTTAANLALAEARSGRRVALVDLDLRQPYLDRFFGLLYAQGLTDVALGKMRSRRRAAPHRPRDGRGRLERPRGAFRRERACRARLARRADVGAAAAGSR